jgi:hypothetical protein
MKESPTSPRPGHRSIAVEAHSPSGAARSGTSYHLNYVDVPRDLEVSHQKGEPLLVTLVLENGRVLLTELK